ncbi:IclR family transcriptional regulator [Nigerium sp.]|uniref:IclR family transcriptional regulator n=1 Tax=Nigerium sp. TaxID=2042655 RepID=UPI003221F86D
MSDHPVAPVEAIDRALRLLDALARAGADGATLAELSASEQLNKSTAYRALATLRARGFCTQQGGNGHYVLGAAAIGLGDSFYSDVSLRTLLHPAILALCREVDELVHLGVLAGDQVVYLDKVEPERSIRVWSRVGQTVPAATSSLGRAVLSRICDSVDQLPPYLAGLPASQRPEPARLWRMLQDARRRGFATEWGENQPGVACLGVPVLRGISAVAAISVTAPAERMTAERCDELAGVVGELVPRFLPSGLTIPPLGGN